MTLKHLPSGTAICVLASAVALGTAGGVDLALSGIGSFTQRPSAPLCSGLPEVCSLPRPTDR